MAEITLVLYADSLRDELRLWAARKEDEKEMLEKRIAELEARNKRLERAVAWGQQRLDMLLREQKNMRGPEQRLVCDIIANGALLPDPTGGRHGKR